MDLPIDPETVKGFLPAVEGFRLHELAVIGARVGPCLEVGSYCGRSTVYLGAACQAAGQLLFAVDHHRGSEEHQAGEEYHDAALFDAALGKSRSASAATPIEKKPSDDKPQSAAGPAAGQVAAKG